MDPLISDMFFSWESIREGKRVIKGLEWLLYEKNWRTGPFSTEKRLHEWTYERSQQTHENPKRMCRAQLFLPSYRTRGIKLNKWQSSSIKANQKELILMHEVRDLLTFLP